MDKLPKAFYKGSHCRGREWTKTSRIYRCGLPEEPMSLPEEFTSRAADRLQPGRPYCLPQWKKRHICGTRAYSLWLALMGESGRKRLSGVQHLLFP